MSDISASPCQQTDNRAAAASANKEQQHRQLPELLSALLLTAIAVYFHWVNFTNVGGLWRDEANSVVLATLPDLSQLWASLQYDSFPALHYLAIRCWALLFGAGDTSLRLLGLTTGIMLIGALWYKAVGLGSRTPLVSLLLIGLNPLMIRFLDALRPNGLAAIATVLAFTAVWRTIRRPDSKHLIVTTIILVLCVQTLFQEAILVLAIGIAAVATGFMQGGMRRAALLTVPFAIAALSLLPYVNHLQQAAKWSPVAMSPPDEKMLFPGLFKVVSVPFPWMGWIWLTLAAVAIVGMLWGMTRKTCGDDNAEQRRELACYAGVTMVSAATLFMLFLAKGVGISPKPWHYMPLLVLLIIAAEPLIEQCLAFDRRRLGLILCVAGCTAATLYQSSPLLKSRFTSMDLIATAITRAASPNDLVVLMPWFYGVSFNRYYHGSAPWISFPVLRTNAVHRFDLLKEKMVKPESIGKDLDLVMTTLQKGGKVWIVGAGFVMKPDAGVELLPPAPLPHSGWSSTPYLTNWSKYLMASLAVHSGEGEELFVNAPEMLQPQESPAIMVFQGYMQ